MKQEKILIFCAHNDDQIVGPGGALIKYAKKGAKFKTYVYSYGESAPLHIQDHLVVEMRVREAYDSDIIMKGNGIYFFGLKEGKYLEGFAQKNIGEKIKRILKREKPDKIFTHSINDPHPDHQAVYKSITQVLDEVNYKGEVYSFDVWNPLNIRRRTLPKLVVDTSDTFKTKIKAFLAHKSQKLAIFTLLGGIYFKDWWNGKLYGYKKAEVFFKIR